MKRHLMALAACGCALALAPSTALASGQSGGALGSVVKQAQSASNQNTTEQSASSEASSQQTNVNAPVAILSPGSNNGDVHQSNEAETSSSASNGNSTQQGNEQSQSGAATGGSHDGSCGCDGGPKGSGDPQVSQSQSADNNNETTQKADSKASSEQTNVNAPVAILSPESNNGDVHQSNEADTSSSAKNENNTNQGNSQDQKATADGSKDGGGSQGGPCGCKGHWHHGRDGKAGPRVEQSQSASNDNGTSQSAKSSASNEQTNVNEPFSKSPSHKRDGESCGCKHAKGEDRHGGDVHQSNEADTSSSAKNENNTKQGNDQSQEGSAS